MEEDQKYTAICSAVTLQSEKKGFFMAMAQQVTENIGQQWLKMFSELKTDEERIKFCYNNDKVQAMFIEPLSRLPEMYRRKSGQISCQKRQEGDKALIAGDLQQALMMYSQSVIRAPSQGKDMTVDDGLSLAFALAARAEVLLMIHEYTLCIQDLQLAIKQGYPEITRHQLYWHMGCAYRGLNKIAKARVSFQLSLKLLEKHSSEININTDSVKKMIECDLEFLDEISETEAEEQINADQNSKKLPEVTKEHHSILENASSLLTVSETAEAGRFFTAKKVIHAGDTLVVESPYAACLSPQMFGSHCHHCFTRLKAPHACLDCSGVAFCSEACHSEACSTYHKYECHYMDVMQGSGMSVLCHLALRMITQTDLQTFIKLHQKQDTEEAKKYAAVCSLVTHADKRTPTDFLHRTLMSIFLLQCLQKAKYFPGKKNKDSLSKEELLVASSILKHLQLLQFNAHEIYETKLSAPKKYRSSSMNYVAIGVYPTVAMFNHECYVGIAKYFMGRHIVVCATRPVQPGEVVAENYGPGFTKQTLSERQRTLSSRYWFQCTCVACTENWPLLKDMENDFNIKCMKCPQATRVSPDVDQEVVKCTSCGDDIKLSKFIECQNKYRQSIEAVDEGDTTRGIELLTSYLDTVHSICVPPHRSMSHAQDLLRVCMAINGNLWIPK